MTKFLGQNGLEYYNSKLKKRIDEVEAKIGSGGSGGSGGNVDLTSVNKAIKANTDNISTLDTSLKSHVNDTSVHFTKSEMQTELTKDVLPGQLLTLMDNKISGVDLVTTLNALDNQADLEEQLKTKPVTLEDVFNNWTRFSHYLGNQSASHSENSTVRRGWGYNASKNAISMSQNLDPYGGFISEKKYSNYNVSIHGYCYSSGDDDIIGIVVGFLSSSESADGKEHTLSVIRCGASSNGFVTDNSTRNKYTFALVYDLGNYAREIWDAKVLASGTGTTLRGSDWTSTGAMISVIRQGTKIQAQTTQMGNLKDYVNSKMPFIGILGSFNRVGKLVMDYVRVQACYARYFIKYDFINGAYGSKNNTSRGIPDYTESSLFKGIRKKQIEEKNCTWENCCKLVEGEE